MGRSQRQALEFALNLVELGEGRVHIAQIEVELLHQRLKVEPGARKCRPALGAHRADNVGRIARRQLRGQVVASILVVDDDRDQLDLVL